MTGVLADTLLGASHPYYPVDLKLPGYAPPSLPLKVVLAVFFSVSALLLLVSWVLSGIQSPCVSSTWCFTASNIFVYCTGRQRHLHTVDRIVFCWFALTGVIHLVVEGRTSLLQISWNL